MKARPAVTVIVGLALAGFSLPAAAAPAVAPSIVRPAGGSCSITGYSPRTVVVGSTPSTRTFTIAVSGCSLDAWSLEGSSPANFFVYDGATQATFSPDSMLNSSAGLSSVVATADDQDFDETQRTFANSFDLQRRTTVQSGSFNASPEPVAKGGTVTITGRVKVVDWEAYPRPTYVSFAHHHVNVQFRTTTGTYRTVQTVISDGNGMVRTTAKQTVSGAWRLQYNGTTVYSAFTGPADAVALRV